MHSGQRHITDTDSYYARTPSFDRLDMPAQQRMVEAHQILEQVAADNTPHAPVEVKMARDLGKFEVMLDQANERVRAAEEKDYMAAEELRAHIENAKRQDQEIERLKKEVQVWKASSIEFERLYNNYVAKQRKKNRR